MTEVKLIVHRLTRQTFDGAISLDAGEHLTTGLSLSLLKQCHQTFRRLQPKAWGKFSETNVAVEALIHDYLADQQSFVSLARRLSEHMAQYLSDCEQSFDAWLLMAHDALHQQFHCYWLPPTASLALDGARVVEVEHFDTSQIKAGFLLDLGEKAQNNDQPYLQCYMAYGMRALGKALVDAFGFEAAVETEDETHILLENLRTFVATQPETEQRALHQQMIDVCLEHDKIGAPIELQALTDRLPDSARDAFVEFLGQCDQPPPERVHLNRQYLKRYVRFYGRTRDLSVSFSSDQLGRGVTYVPEEDILYIHQIPESLKKQLKRYLHQESM